MWSRRGFLGSVLGLVAGQSFLVKAFDEPPQRVVLPYRMCFRDVESGLLLQAPGVKDVVRVPGGFTFVAEPLAVHQAVGIKSMALFNARNELVCESPLKTERALISGDVFNGSLTVRYEGGVVECPEHLVEMCLRHDAILRCDP